ncbi:MAG: amidase family protein [Alphaproteobacteria bacterium]
MKLSEYTAQDALGLAALVRAGEVTPAELAEAAFRAIDAVNDRLNAVIARLEPPAAGTTPGARAPFHGVPFLIKDLLHGWGGLRCDMGSRLAEGYVYERDGALAARYKQSGLVAIGRSNTPELGLNAVTEPVLYGPTRNPWDPSRSPGGSSGGAGAAVAAGIVPLAHANDGGGSIRIPAAWCGLVGLKPSRGRNPLVPPAEGEAAYGLLAHHVIARSVRDSAAALDVTSGPTGGDYIALPKPERPFLEEVTCPPERLRIALCTRFKETSAPEPECVEAVISAARLCETLGHEIVEATPEIAYPEVAALCFELYMLIAAKTIETAAHATGRAPGPETLEPHTRATLERARATGAMELVASLDRLNRMSRVMGRFMADYDVLLTPAVSRAPCPIGAFSPEGYDEGDLSYWSAEMECYTFLPLFSITGQPSMILPLHWSADGLPLGVQIVAPIGGEAILFRLAGQLERAQPWAARRPPIHAASASQA